MKTIPMLVAMTMTMAMSAFSTVALAQDEEPAQPTSIRRTGQSIGGPRGREVNGFPAGTEVAFRDPKNPDEYTDGVVIRKHVFLDQKLDGNGGSTPRVAGYELIVPSTVPGGESKVVSVDLDGKIKGEATMGEYIASLQRQLATDLRNYSAPTGALAAGKRQTAAAGAKLDKLNEKSRKLTDRYETAGGRSRLLTEIGIAIAVDRAGKALPAQYKNMAKSDSAILNSIIKVGIESTGAAAGDLVKDPTKDGVQAGAVNFGLTAGTGSTVAPLLESLVQSGQISNEQAGRALKAANALVKIGLAAGTAEDGEALEAAKKQALEELYSSGLPPGVGIIARDATDMGLQIIEYGIISSELMGGAINLDVAADIANRISATRRALREITAYDALARQQAGVLVPAIPTANPGVVGFNGPRDARTVPVATAAAGPNGNVGKGGSGVGVSR